MNREKKKKVIKKHAQHNNDTGSAPVQIGILTERIKALSDHLKEHPKDKHSKRGLLGMVGKRRRHLNYLKRKDEERYQQICKSLKLRK